MQLEYLSYLREIYRTGSISKASEVLNVSQPALSTALKSVEKELGITLFKRGSKGVQPTEQGLKILSGIEQICEITAEWKQMVSSEVTAAEGTVSFGAVKSFNSAFFLDIFARLKLEYPKLGLSIHEVSRKELNHHLSNNTTNIGCDFYLEHHGLEQKELLRLGYEVEPLIQDHFVVEISGEHPFAQLKTLGKKELQQIPYATYANHADPIYRVTCQNLGIEGSFFMDSVDVLQKLVESNQAFVLVPARTAAKQEAVISGKTVIKEIRDFSLPIQYYCIHLPEQDLSREERALLNLLRNYFWDLKEKENNSLK